MYCAARTDEVEKAMPKKNTPPPAASSSSSSSFDGGSLGLRVKRYGQVSTTMVGLAARVAGEKFFGLHIEKESHAQDLAAALGSLKGPLMKVGQILATIPEALPPEYAEKLGTLQSNAPPMGWAFVRRRMKSELGPDWETRFRSFEREAAAAASLGQVHKAVAKDGRVVACKLQYPDMESAIAADLQQLKLIFSVYETYDNAVKTSDIYTELRERLYEELDYELEARYETLYHTMLKNEEGVRVPEVVPDLSTRRLLTSTWLEGDKILTFKAADQNVRNQIAARLFRAWYVPLYRYGVIHGDPHLGNYSVSSDLSVNLLDFGCVRIFPEKFVAAVIALYQALRRGDRDLAVYAYETWGFGQLSKAQIETLDLWARFLYGPLLEDKVRLIGEANGQVYGSETARTVHKKLREAGGVKIPREFVFMDRAALGLGSVFIHLGARLNWHRLFEELIDGFQPDILHKQQKAALGALRIQKG